VQAQKLALQKQYTLTPQKANAAIINPISTASSPLLVLFGSLIVLIKQVNLNDN
jgi:hypothetical protein|tara:strand:- start:21775 stop:21936 length:162 start_codon:yes stop_codon:yes gene_type:complete